MKYAKAIGDNNKLPLTDKRYNEVINSFDKLHELYNFEVKFDFVAENYFELQKCLLENSLSNSLFHNNFKINDFFRIDRKINRKMFNFLSVAKLYVDQIAGCVKHLYPEEFENVKKDIESFKTNDFANKFMIALRNHMQHYSVSTNLSSGFNDKTNKDRSERFLFFYETLILEAQSFMADSKNKKDFSNEIEIDSKIEVLDILKDYFENLYKKHDEIRELLKSKKEEWINCINNVYSEYMQTFNFKFELEQDLLELHDEDKRIVVTTNTIKFLNELEHKNLHFDNTAIRVACNMSKRQLDMLKKM